MGNCINCQQEMTIKLEEDIYLIRGDERLKVGITNCVIKEAIRTTRPYNHKEYISIYKLYVRNYKKVSDFILKGEYEIEFEDCEIVQKFKKLDKNIFTFSVRT